MVGPHSLFTKFRVQWSKLDSFNVIHGDTVVFCSSNEGRAMECIINGLEDAERFFVRASFGNLKGFGPFSASIPKSVIPSSWRNVQGNNSLKHEKRNRYRGWLSQFGTGLQMRIFQNVLNDYFFVCSCFSA